MWESLFSKNSMDFFCPEIGYVQVQTFLGAMFLLNLDLFDSFICFSNLLHRPYFQALYRFNNLDKYLQLFQQSLDYHLPKLSAHFIQMSTEPICFCIRLVSHCYSLHVWRTSVSIGYISLFTISNTFTWWFKCHGIIQSNW